MLNLNVLLPIYKDGYYGKYKKRGHYQNPR